MRMHGSVMPKMILPLLCVAAWSTLITCLSHYFHHRKFFPERLRVGSTDSDIVGVNNILLTVLGFVVGLALSFRSSTAYERYSSRRWCIESRLRLTRRRWADGRKYWAQLIQTSRNLARTIWVNTSEREGEEGKVDLLRKLYVGPNLASCIRTKY